MEHRNKIWLGMGANLGDRLHHLKQACSLLQEAGIEICSRSSVYESDAWGYQSTNAFLNVCVICEGIIDPISLLHLIKEAESKLGRSTGGSHYQDRSIDIDILFFDDFILNRTDLIIPHPRIAERKFVLRPLVEIDPQKIHPILEVTVSRLYQQCSDKGRVEKWHDRSW